MAGKKCPSCEKLTLFTVGNKSTCDCGFEMTVPPNDGKGGKGIQCPNCAKNTLFKNGKKGVCRNCGAVCEFPEK